VLGQLADTEQRHQTLLEQLPVGIYRTTTRGRIVHANRALAEMLGYELDELDELSAADVFVNPDERASQLSEWLERGGVVSNELKFKRGDGTTIWIRDTGQAIRDESGAVRYFDGIVEDITERKLAEQALEQQSRLAAMGQLAAGIAHGFNNMLCGIIANVEMLRRSSALTEADSRRLDAIAESAEQAAEVMRQILDFSRRQETPTRKLDVVQAVEAVLAILHSNLPEDSEIIVDADPGSYLVEAELSGLQQALINLVLNAKEAIGVGGTIRIRVARETISAGRQPLEGMLPGEWITLDVIDDGAGIPAANLPRLFEPFFSTKPESSGAGLGLAQAYGLVSRFGGRIGVQSEAGAGATFTIYLPAV
jgi:PAS domain S-box-containing protein